MPQPLHDLLARQLKRYLENAEAAPPEWMRLIEAVNSAYHEFDQDRGMLERSLELSSEELIQANADLRESQMRYRTFIDSTADLVFLKDESFRYLFINEAYRAFLGRSQESVIGCTDFDLLPQEMAAHCRATDLKALAKGQCVTAEEPVGFILFQTVKFPVPLPGGRMGVGGYIRDITDHKQAEDHLRFHAQLLDSVKESVVASDLEGLILYWGVGAEKLYGYRSEEVMGKPYRNFAGPIEAPAEERFRQEIIAHGSWRGEHLQKNRKGETFWTSSFISLVTDEHGQPTGFIGIDQDITPYKRAAMALQQSEVELRGILDTTADGILAIDSRGKVIKANQRFADIWHIPQAILESEEDSVLLDYVLDQLSTPEVFLEKVKTLYGSTEVSLDLLAFKDGRTIERYSAPLLMEGSLLGRVWSFRDITEQQSAEAALRESEARNRALVHAIPDLIFTNRRDGEYLSIHASDSHSLAAAPETVLHRKISEVLPPPVADQCLKAIGAALDSGAMQELTYSLPLEGQERHFEARITPCTEDTVVTFVRDITARKQAEEAQSRQLDELRRWQAVTLGREGRIGELKREVNALAARLGQPPPYGTPESVEREGQG